MAFLTEAANRGSISTGYDIDNSLKFERANSEKLSRTPSSAGNLRTWTYSFWVKRTQLGINSYHLEAKGSGDKFFILGFNENDQILFYDIYSADYGKVFTRRFRDTSAWYHIVLRADTTNGTAGNRMRLYVNGVQETAVTSDYGDFPQNHDTQINKTVVHNIGYRTDINQYASGYMAETCLIDGTSLGPDSFGQLDSATGIWKPIDVSGLTFGTNGFYQEYKSSSALGADTVPGGNSIDYTTSNIAAADQATDTPTNNFCTLNLQVPNYVNTGGATEGGTKIPYSGVNHYGAWYGTQGFTKGKWYWEAYIPSRSGSYGLTNEMGVHTMENNILGSPYYANAFKTSYYLNFHYGYTYAWDNGTKGSKNSEDGVPAFGTGQVGSWVGLAFNADDGEATWYLDGSQTGNANLDIYDLYDKMQEGIFGVPFFQVYHNDLNVNFGGYSSQAISSGNTDANGYGNFEYAPPSGYYALCTKNLAEYG